jgi:hypothetical protein
MNFFVTYIPKKPSFVAYIPKKIGANTEIFWSQICEIFGNEKCDLLATKYIVAY